jgi:hypothetical protein
MRSMQVLATCELSNISTAISIPLHSKSCMAIQMLQTLFSAPKKCQARHNPEHFVFICLKLPQVHARFACAILCLGCETISSGLIFRPDNQPSAVLVQGELQCGVPPSMPI